MGIEHIAAVDKKYCDRCRKDITDAKPDSTQTFTRVIETTIHYKWSVISHNDRGANVITSRIDFCDECMGDWSMFLQGRAVPPTERGAGIDERAAAFEARRMRSDA